MPPWFPEPFDVAAWTRPARMRGTAYHVDRVLATLADLQHGTVACRQLLALGVTYGQIRARVMSGHLHRLHVGVYAVGRRALTGPARRMAVVLAGGPGARLRGWSAATQRDLLPEAGTQIDLAVPTDRRVALPGVSVNRVRPIPAEVGVAGGVPAHTVARLLLDLARRPDGLDVLEWAWRQAIFTRSLDHAAVHTVLGDHDGEPGTPALRAMCDRRAALVGTLRNRFELGVASILREAGVKDQDVLCNIPHEFAPGVVLTPDFRIPSLNLIIESDGRDGHDDVEFMVSDAERDAHYERAGYIVMRVTFWQAHQERGRILSRLADIRAAHVALAR